eukprot:CAMPEP_0198722296 /NCGR_PEP_ID=MMETSP1475-20131203/74_1 /TAXON_ID= ORGANISM="Unidentified sp., Strain CCMP1999" /NCGR_SAMPLE_ID=MMETSP1475 /ASSEMBLY_ACC=CAM_ASM_001111 /LENGTH=387 /DNA_ID=CAMNT_0044483199 /DNA_START=70 /DNA_END=1234 /DNA_ORIENTATION=-
MTAFVAGLPLLESSAAILREDSQETEAMLLKGKGHGAPRTTSRGFDAENTEQGEGRFDREIPPLYDGWFSRTGIIANQVQEIAADAVNDGQRFLEISFPPVPNVDEVKFGTKLNSMFAEDIARYLDMTDDVKKVKRYLIEFANAYWAARLAEAFPDRDVRILFSDSVKKDNARLPPNVVEICPLRRAGNSMGKNDVVVVVDPGPTENWKRGRKLAGDDRVVVMLNSGFVETYDLCGPLKEFDQVYYLKRVSKGWVFHAGKQPWISYLERPDGSVEVLETRTNRPSLGEVSKELEPRVSDGTQYTTTDGLLGLGPDCKSVRRLHELRFKIKSEVGYSGGTHLCEGNRGLLILPLKLLHSSGSQQRSGGALQRGKHGQNVLPFASRASK